MLHQSFTKDSIPPRRILEWLWDTLNRLCFVNRQCTSTIVFLLSLPPFVHKYVTPLMDCLNCFVWSTTLLLRVIFTSLEPYLYDTNL